MRLVSLSLTDWRNYPSAEFLFHPGVNLFTGENAQGKTNLLEAVEMLSSGHAFRAVRDNEAVRFGAEFSRLRGEIEQDGRIRTVEIAIPSAGKKQILTDHAASTAAALAGKLPTVLFCPVDLNLIQSGPADRRRLMDSALCQLRPRYSALLAEYRRVHLQKTSVLKQASERRDLLATLPDYNERIITIGAELIRFRAAFVRLLGKYAGDVHREIGGGEELSVAYRTVSTVEDPFGDPETIRKALREHLDAHAEAEIASASCLSGPHRDDLYLAINGREARNFASQGQCRTAAIALKLGCRQLMENDLGVTPLLLLDDILSELDSKRQDYVLNRIDRGQIFITGCDTEAAARLKSGRIFRIAGGSVAETRDFGPEEEC